MTDRISAPHVKIMFSLEQDEDGYPPATTESLWAIDVGAGLYQIDNIPFFATDIALNDIVSAKLEHGALQYEEVVRPSGHSTLRVIVYDASEMPTVRAFFEQMGCSTELSHLPRLVAIAVPPSVALEPLRQVLAVGREQDRWDYEEACLGNP
ncbi:MAG TPA: DUF4265 domain-containing protein [Hyalangium sp.]|jgi:hypothetical protein|nr:DUF4265 domain-containing protein [Hyalangium sp.]